MATRKQVKLPLILEEVRHEGAHRLEIPSVEQAAGLAASQAKPVPLLYPRNPDLDPQLVWRGKDAQNLEPLVIGAPPLFVQERIHPKSIVQALMEQTQAAQAPPDQTDLFATFDLPTGGEIKATFYEHEHPWTNRLILGDSLRVMASLAEREALRGKVQCIYFDPPYGIKFNSNFQWSTTSREVKDGRIDNITREPEQVRAFRDTWRDGIHSYLSYLRDRLVVARDLLTDTGSIFVQISEENVHRVRAVLDEVFGDENHVSDIVFRKKTMPLGANFLEQMADIIIWFAKRKYDANGRVNARYHQLKRELSVEPDANFRFARQADGSVMELSSDERQRWDGSGDLFRLKSMEPSGPMESGRYRPTAFGRTFDHPKNGYAVDEAGMARLVKADRVQPLGRYLNYLLYKRDTGNLSNLTTPWFDTAGPSDKRYVVQTSDEVIKRCILMTTDPGDLVLDPTCGGGTTAYVAEQWGRRWITIDTSRVALALTRARLLGARYPYYLLADSPEGQRKEAELSRAAVSNAATGGSVRLGFVYARVPHITLKDIAGNREIDAIWERWQPTLGPLLQSLNGAVGAAFEEWEVPREPMPSWSAAAAELHRGWWEARLGRQRDVDVSIAAASETEYLVDRPYEDKKRVRVAGPFTVESASPNRMVGFDGSEATMGLPPEASSDAEQRFVEMALEQLRQSGVQQPQKTAKVTFDSVHPFAGRLICAEGSFVDEAGQARRAAILVGPEFGSVGAAEIASAATEAASGRFDMLVACAFHFDADSSSDDTRHALPVLKARMNADLHMAADLKNNGRGNLFVVFGEPDIELKRVGELVQVSVRGIDIFRPSTGTVETHQPDDIACWFVDTDYNGEHFIVRQAYFLGQEDPYESLRRTLKAEISEEAWATVYRSESRPFAAPSKGRIAVKVINHLGDEVTKVIAVT